MTLYVTVVVFIVSFAQTLQGPESVLFLSLCLQLRLRVFPVKSVEINHQGFIMVSSPVRDARYGNDGNNTSLVDSFWQICINIGTTIINLDNVIPTAKVPARGDPSLSLSLSLSGFLQEESAGHRVIFLSSAEELSDRPHQQKPLPALPPAEMLSSGHVKRR